MWLFTNALINTHYHYLADGQVISHAHPYDKKANQGTPFQSHKHTDTQLIFLSILDKTDAVVSGFFILCPLAQGIIENNNFIPAEAPVQICYQVHHYHAPPV